MGYQSERYAAANRWDPHHLRAVLRYISPEPGHRLLELGCGRGHLLRRLQELGFDATGIDLNPAAIASGVAGDMRVMSGDRLEFGDGEFDSVVSIHTIEHIPNLDGALREMERVVKPGGTLVLVYPAEPIQGLYAIPTSIILHGTPAMARKVHCHKVTPSRLRRRVAPLALQHIDSTLSLLRWPQFTTALRRLPRVA